LAMPNTKPRLLRRSGKMVHRVSLRLSSAALAAAACHRPIEFAA
jgi:hypothetical protein